MKIQPTLSKVKEIAATDRYNVLPVSLEIFSDFTTPIETMKILKNVSTHCYMLESAQANETWGRYTFLGYDPKTEITCIAIRIAYKKNGKVFVRSGAGIVADSVPEKEFEECLNKEKSSLRALALTADGEIMAVQHREYPVYGVQFHPESIMTPNGKQMLYNFIKVI